MAKRGRPKLGDRKKKSVFCWVDPPMKKDIDRFAKKHRMKSRSSAVRRLVEIGLGYVEGLALHDAIGKVSASVDIDEVRMGAALKKFLQLITRESLPTDVLPEQGLEVESIATDHAIDNGPATDSSDSDGIDEEAVRAVEAKLLEQMGGSV